MLFMMELVYNVRNVVYLGLLAIGGLLLHYALKNEVLAFDIEFF